MSLVKIPLILEVRIPVPSVELSILRDNTVLIAFSERVDFRRSDIVVVGGMLDNFSGNGQQYVVDVIRTASQTTLSVPAGVVSYLDQPNTASNTLVL